MRVQRAVVLFELHTVWVTKTTCHDDTDNIACNEEAFADLKERHINVRGEL